MSSDDETYEEEKFQCEHIITVKVKWIIVFFLFENFFT